MPALKRVGRRVRHGWRRATAPARQQSAPHARVLPPMVLALQSAEQPLSRPLQPARRLGSAMVAAEEERPVPPKPLQSAGAAGGAPVPPKPPGLGMAAEGPPG